MSILDNLLIEAMNSEIEAKNFYNDASKKAQSQAGKKLFRELAEFEQNHYKRVKKLLNYIKKDWNLRNLEQKKIYQQYALR